MNKKIILTFLICIVFISESLFAAEPSVLQAEHVTVVFEEPLRSVAQEVAGLYPFVKQELESTFQWSLDFRPAVVLIRDRRQFQRAVDSDLMVAYAVPRRNVMVIDYTRMNTSPFTLRSTLKHELCHLLLHHYIDRSNLPKWFDEGVSQWASDGIAEIIMDYKHSNLTRAVLSGRYFGMRQLSTGFPKDRDSLQLAYAQSKSLVEYVSREYGKEAILSILNHLRSGRAFEKAIQKSLSISFTDLERDWLDYLKHRNTWFTYISVHMYEFLFVLGAIIVVIGFIRIVIKKKRYKDLEDEDDYDAY
jgi:hypothetical protein